ncbi:MAG: hypothetical protein AAF636_13830 [Pseudomonadota bacterium]
MIRDRNTQTKEQINLFNALCWREALRDAMEGFYPLDASVEHIHEHWERAR